MGGPIDSTSGTPDLPAVPDSGLGARMDILKVLPFEYSVSGGDDGEQGTIGLNAWLPDNARVIACIVDVITTFTSAGDTATIALQVEGANDLVSAIAINDGDDPWDAGGGTIPVPDLQDMSTQPKTTQTRQVSAVVATQDLTAGKLQGYLLYFVSE